MGERLSSFNKEGLTKIIEKIRKDHPAESHCAKSQVALTTRGQLEIEVKRLKKQYGYAYCDFPQFCSVNLKSME
jgi:hypothetical protein